MLPLKTEWMLEDFEKKRRQQVSRMKALMDYAMGIFFVLIGFFFFFRNKFNISFNERFPPDDLDKILGAMCLLYGAWRIYRGYQKKYFR